MKWPVSLARATSKSSQGSLTDLQCHWFMKVDVVVVEPLCISHFCFLMKQYYWVQRPVVAIAKSKNI